MSGLFASSPTRPIPKSPSPSSTSTTTTTNLATLPTELIHLIATHLPTSALISLKLTTKQLYHQLPSPPQHYIKTASSCEKRAVRRYVAESRELRGGRRKCVLCDGLMPLEMFGGRAEPVCKWHGGWFERVLVVAKGGVPAAYGVEKQRRVRRLCGHCKLVRGWDVDVCGCEADGGCGSCGSWEVECWVRLVEVE